MLMLISNTYDVTFLEALFILENVCLDFGNCSGLCTKKSMLDFCMRANNKVLLSIYSTFVSGLIIYALMFCEIIENLLYKKSFIHIQI